jgi:protocatechuate 3,4-dioxygenase beta subunit
MHRMTKTINRRQALAGIGTVSLGALLAACGSDDPASTTAEVATTDGATTTVEPRSGSDLAALFDDSSACTLTPEETEGPYYFDADAIRSDIREDREGTTLRLVLRIRDAQSCEPIRNAVVEVWHCDAAGVYSGFEAASTGGPAGGSGPTDDERYLRGAQVTDKDGIVELTTIYPGWYTGRTVHIHAKVHTDSQTVLTTQLYFDEAVTAAVSERQPYASDADRDTFNDTDPIFDEALLLALTQEGDGYLGTQSFDVATA